MEPIGNEPRGFHGLSNDDLLAPVGDVNCIFVTFPCGILGQVWNLIVSFPDLCHILTFITLSVLFI